MTKKITILLALAVALALPFNAMAAGVTFGGDINLQFSGGALVQALNSAKAEQVTVNDNNTITVVTGSDTDITIRSNDRYVLSGSIDSGSPIVTGSCSDGNYHQIQITDTAVGQVTVSIDTTTTCDGAPSGGGGGGGVGGGGVLSLSPLSIGSGVVTYTIPAGEEKDIGFVNASGTNVLLYETSRAIFTTTCSEDMEVCANAMEVTDLELGARSMTLTFLTPIATSLIVGESKNVDIDSDGVDDVRVDFNALEEYRIDMTITNILSGVVEPLILGIKEYADLEAGDLIKTENHSAVYLINEEGQRQLYPSEAVFWAWYDGTWQEQGVVLVSQDTFDLVDAGQNITAPVGSVIQFINSQRVYAVSANSTNNGTAIVYMIEPTEAAVDLFGADWQDLVIEIEVAFELNYSKSGVVLTADSELGDYGI